MEVKRDTKEKFHVITVETVSLSANMTEDLSKQLLIILQDNIKNVVLNLKNVKTIDEKSAESIVKTQQRFYEQNASFVICELTADLENFLDKQNLLEIMNVTPTEIEAGDIVQMEELERELLDEDCQS
jgi:anti-anti-sigma regulatory factor